MSKEQYKDKIVEMLSSIGNIDFIEMIYGFVKRLAEIHLTILQEKGVRQGEKNSKAKS